MSKIWHEKYERRSVYPNSKETRMERTGMQRATLGKSGSVVTRTASESDFQKQFGEYYGDDGCHSIYFDSSPIVPHRSSVLPYKVSNDAT